MQSPLEQPGGESGMPAIDHAKEAQFTELIQLIRMKSQSKAHLLDQEVQRIINTLQLIPFFEDKFKDQSKPQKQLIYKQIANCLQYEEAKEGVDVITYGEEADKLYLLLSGVCDVYVPTQPAGTAGD